MDVVLPSFTLSSVVIYAVLVAATGVCYCAPTSLESDIESACADQACRPPAIRTFSANLSCLIKKKWQQRLACQDNVLTAAGKTYMKTCPVNEPANVQKIGTTTTCPEGCLPQRPQSLKVSLKYRTESYQSYAGKSYDVQLRVTWEAPQASGSKAAPTGYLVELFVGGEAERVLLPPTERAFTFSCFRRNVFYSGRWQLVEFYFCTNHTELVCPYDEFGNVGTPQWASIQVTALPYMDVLSRVEQSKRIDVKLLECADIRHASYPCIQKTIAPSIHRPSLPTPSTAGRSDPARSSVTRSLHASHSSSTQETTSAGKPTSASFTSSDTTPPMQATTKVSVHPSEAISSSNPASSFPPGMSSLIGSTSQSSASPSTPFLSTSSLVHLSRDHGTPPLANRSRLGLGSSEVPALVDKNISSQSTSPTKPYNASAADITGTSFSQSSKSEQPPVLAAADAPSVIACAAIVALVFGLVIAWACRMHRKRQPPGCAKHAKKRTRVWNQYTSDAEKIDIYISYSRHEPEDRKKLISDFGFWLSGQGFHVCLDQWFINDGFIEAPLAWIDSKIEHADVIIVICSQLMNEDWYRAQQDPDESIPDYGLTEALMIRTKMARRAKSVVPLLLSGTGEDKDLAQACIPLFLRSQSIFSVEVDASDLSVGAKEATQLIERLLIVVGGDHHTSRQLPTPLLCQSEPPAIQISRGLWSSQSSVSSSSQTGLEVSESEADQDSSPAQEVLEM